MNNYSQYLAQPLRQKGIAVVECVIVLPLVLFMILAVAEIGNAIQQYNSLTQATRDAARYASKQARGQSGIIELTAANISTAQNLVSYGQSAGGAALLPGLTPANVTVSVVDTENVSVVVAYNYQPIFTPNIPGLVGTNDVDIGYTLRTEVIMRIL